MQATETAQCIEIFDVMKDWDTFRRSLKEGIATARKFGMSEDEIQKTAVRIGDFLNEKVCPATKEEQLLKEMWDVGTPDERRVLATILFKMVK